jgi:hypothetical protein
VSARHAPGCVEDACGDVGEIDGYENRFHRLVPSGSNLAHDLALASTHSLAGSGRSLLQSRGLVGEE